MLVTGLVARTPTIAASVRARGNNADVAERALRSPLVICFPSPSANPPPQLGSPSATRYCRTPSGSKEISKRAPRQPSPLDPRQAKMILPRHTPLAARGNEAFFPFLFDVAAALKQTDHGYSWRFPFPGRIPDAGGESLRATSARCWNSRASTRGFLSSAAATARWCVPPVP